ncbi:MAG TPA: HPF/RaiA family ribosome-associated protein [Chitinophagaceae bacterium]|jgi:putative sigma-54 modulation protein|nr:HPF/RaiA family ribosome-associated protein [Chitinophagaceae bacterium]
MHIEFHTPQGQVKQWIIDFVKEKLLEFYHKDREIARAEVYFKQQGGNDADNKVCEITLTIYGNSLFVHRKAATFEQASRETIDELTGKVNEQIRQQNEPPDQTTSTIKV